MTFGALISQHVHGTGSRQKFARRRVQDICVIFQFFPSFLEQVLSSMAIWKHFIVLFEGFYDHTSCFDSVRKLRSEESCLPSLPPMRPNQIAERSGSSTQFVHLFLRKLLNGCPWVLCRSLGSELASIRPYFSVSRVDSYVKLT